MGNMLVRALDRTLDAVIVVICVLLLLIGVYSVLDNIWLYENAQDRSVLVYRPALDEPLTEERLISEKQVAWVYIDETTIDYPIMQGADNYEYLNKDPYGGFSLSGSIFLDARNDPGFTDDYSLVYGHHMAHKAMFGALDDFQDRAFFDAHRSGSVVTQTAAYDMALFAVCFADAKDPAVFDPGGRTHKEITRFLKENALIYTDPNPGERIVALSTCSGETDTTRLLVFGTIREHLGE